MFSVSDRFRKLLCGRLGHGEYRDLEPDETHGLSVKFDPPLPKNMTYHWATCMRCNSVGGYEHYDASHMPDMVIHERRGEARRFA